MSWWSAHGSSGTSIPRPCATCSIYELDFEPLLVTENPGGIFEVLRDPARFQLAAGNYALVWLNPVTGEYDGEAIDIAPECIRFFCERYGRLLKAAGQVAA